MEDHLIHFITTLTYLGGFVLISTGAGNLMLPKSIFIPSPLSCRIVFSCAVGFAALSFAIFFLAAFQHLNRMSVSVLLMGFAALSVRGWQVLLRGCGKNSFSVTNFVANPTASTRYVFFLLAGLLVLGMCFVLTPATGRDALSYHLEVPRLYIKHQGLYFIPGNFFSNYPLNAEMLFLAALMVQGDMLAKGIHYTALLLLLAAMWNYIKQHVPEVSPGFLPLLIFASIPSVFTTAYMAYTDLLLTLYGFLALFAFTNWFNRPGFGWLVLVAIFTGVAAATKYGGLILLPLGVIGILFAARLHGMSFSRVLPPLAVYLGIAIMVASPYYIKNWILTGNPFYPLFYEIFGGRGWDENLARAHHIFLKNLGMGRGFWDYMLLPFNLSFRAEMNSLRFDGVLGPVFILTLPFVFLIKRISPDIRIGLVFSEVLFVFWAVSAQQVRYLIPIFPFLAITTGYILGRFHRKKTVFSILTLFVFTALMVNGLHIFRQFKRIKPLNYITGQEDRHAFLSRIIPSYDMFRYLNTHLEKDAKIFLIYMKNFGFLCDRAYFSDSLFESYT
ncbi:MAG: hypothetical protein JRI77_11925 [Deltaproteobacteria bacterium]|nr:hypothetical protein [Deltaproteobacteria bacterium]